MQICRLKKLSSHRQAFTLVEIMIVSAILGLLVSIAVPYYVRQTASTQANLCVNTLLKIDVIHGQT